jgi:DNA-binding transcriptional MerR regulator
MALGGLLIGEVAQRTGLSRRALRLYERAGIVPPPRRTPAGYRVYEPAVLGVLHFVTRARRLGISLQEVRQIVEIRRAGRCPCSHVQALARRKVDELDRTIADLTAIRDGLQAVLRRPRRMRQGRGVICSHIEEVIPSPNGGRHGDDQDVAVSAVHRLSRGRDRRRRGAHR